MYKDKAIEVFWWTLFHLIFLIAGLITGFAIGMLLTIIRGTLNV